MPEPSNYWKLADNLTVIQAALLIINEDPTELQYALSDTETKKPEHFQKWALMKRRPNSSSWIMPD